MQEHLFQQQSKLATGDGIYIQRYMYSEKPGPDIYAYGEVM